jgi:hypothetical protein
VADCSSVRSKPSKLIRLYPARIAIASGVRSLPASGPHTCLAHSGHSPGGVGNFRQPEVVFPQHNYCVLICTGHIMVGTDYLKKHDRKLIALSKSQSL